MHCRYVLVLAIITVFGNGLAPAATDLHSVTRWTQHQLAAFPEAPEESIAVSTESLHPLTLAMADFDDDGVPDLLVGYARQNEGVLVLHPGNIDCYRPNSVEALQHRSEGTWSDAPFLSPPSMFEIRAIPEFLLAGDFNGDFKSDVVFGSQSESKVVMLPGNGQGSFESEEYLELPGSITTISSGEVGRRDGHGDLLVGIDGSSGPQLLLYQSMKGAFSADPVVLELPDLARKIVVGQLVGDYLRDFAVAANEFLVIVEGQGRPLEGGFDDSQIDEYSFSAAITDLAAGDFAGDFREELALLTSDGYLSYLETARDDIHKRESIRVHNPSLVLAVDRLSLLRSRISTGPRNDLVFVNRQAREVRLITPEFQSDTSDFRLPLSRTLFTQVEPVAVLSTQLNLDAQNDLVFLNSRAMSVGVALTRPLDSAFVVNQAGGYQDADTSDGICDTDLTEEGSQCTFTAAIQQANAAADLNTITFTETTVGIGLLSITNPVTINGGGAVTISGGLTIEGGGSTISGVTVGYVNFVEKGGNQISDSVIGYVKIDRSSNNTIVGNSISNAFYGIQITDSLDFKNVTAITGIRIEGNTISGCRSAGIFDGSKSKNEGSQGLQVLDNTLVDNRVAAYLGGPGASILNNSIGTDTFGHERGNENGGLTLFGDSSNIQQNTFKYNGSCGLCIAGTEDNTIYDNKIEENLVDGILLFDYTYSDEDEKNLIQKNQLCNNTNAAISDLGSNGLKVLDNEIGGNRAGVDLRGKKALVKDNFIGTTRTGEKLGNTVAGVSVAGSANEIIKNVIAHNGSPPDPAGEYDWDKEGRGSGVEVGWSANDTKISENQIFDNVGAAPNLDSSASQGLGIDHGGNGVSPNQTQGGQNYPVLTTKAGGGGVDITLNSTPNSKFRIELFSNEACDETGYGEGKTFLDAIEVETNTDGNGQGTFPAMALYMTATALITECSSPCPSAQLFNTSEFSQCVTTREPIVVNSVADDPLTGLTECKTSEGECTLRAAIELANLDSNLDEINFDLPEGEAQVIRPKTELPSVKHPVEIDASESEGDQCRPTVGLEGRAVETGLTLQGKASVIKGLAIYNFDNGVVLAGEGEHKVQCNYLGTNLTGEASGLGNKHSGTYVDSNNNQIGGNFVKDRNVISGNDFSGVYIHRKDFNVVQGNYIGTDLTGTHALPNGEGVSVWGDTDETPYTGRDNLIGGPTAVMGQPPGNLISANNRHGIYVTEGEADIQGNIIGADWTGHKALPNQKGIKLSDGADSKIGGPELSKQNLISANKAGIYVKSDGKSDIRIENNLVGTDISGVWALGNETGIVVVGEWNRQVQIGGENVGNTIAFNHTGIITFVDSEGHWMGVKISQNSIFDNTEAGIQRWRGSGDKSWRPRLESAVMIQPSSSPAQSTNWPVATQKTLRVRGTADYENSEVEFFSNLTCHGSGRGQGERYLGTATVQSNKNFEFQAIEPELIGSVISATAIVDGTSEFSNCLVVTRVDERGGTLEHRGNPFSIWVTEGGTLQSAAKEKLFAKIPSHAMFLLGFSSLVVSVESGAGQALGLELSPVADSVVVTLEPPEGMNFDTYYNYGPTPDNLEPHWYEFLYNGLTGAEILEDQILIHFIDGQRGDHDLMINGEIVTLGGPAIMGTTLYFPYNHVTEGSFVGFAVSNLSDEETILNYQPFGEEGSIPDSIHQDEILSLQPGYQLARLGTDIFDHDFGELDQELIDLIAESGELDPADLKPEIDERSWVELISSESEIGSFFQLGTWDLSKQDGSVAFTDQAKEFYFTRVYEGTTAYRGQPVSTYLSIANPNGETIELTLTLHPFAGGSSLNATRSITAKGFLFESISEIFGEGTEVVGGYVEVAVTEGDGAIGFETIEMENQDTVIGLNASFGNEASEAYSAQLASLSVLYTSVNLINIGTESRNLTLTGINADGTNLTSPVSVSLGPGEQYSQDAGQIFGSGTQALGTAPSAQTEFIGSFQMEADGPGVIGDVIFGDSLQLDYAAALPLQTQPFTEAVFNQVANIPGIFFTGLAFYNPGSVAAAVELEVVSAEGTSVGEATKVIEAGQRISPLVPELVPASQGQAGGYVLLTSDRPIIAQLIFGALRSDGTISLFSAVPPTVLE